jgi:hypothetical protein
MLLAAHLAPMLKDGSLLSLEATIKHIGMNATIKQPLNNRLMVRCLVFPSLIGT